VALPETNWRSLDPGEKVRIVEAMGFTRRSEDHTPDCAAGFDAGFRCNCVPDPDHYTVPTDVIALWHQTWDERLAAKRTRR
jgi:hypothetical protein